MKNKRTDLRKIVPSEFGCLSDKSSDTIDCRLDVIMLTMAKRTDPAMIDPFSSVEMHQLISLMSDLLTNLRIVTFQYHD